MTLTQILDQRPGQTAKGKVTCGTTKKNEYETYFNFGLTYLLISLQLFWAKWYSLWLSVLILLYIALS